MRNLFGEPYMALPTAFRYRDELDTSPSASCKVAPQSAGSLKVATTTDGATRTMVEVTGASFPLPLRDPRGAAPVPAPTVAPLETATLLDIPLPRPRPAGPGETFDAIVELGREVAMAAQLGFAVREGGRTVAAGTVTRLLD